MPRFFVPQRDIADGKARLQGGEFRHLQRVLRLREGDSVTVFDDAGGEHEGVIVSMSPRVATVRITASTAAGRESPLAVTLYQGVPKGRKMDLIVEKATELGVVAIIPFVSAFATASIAAAESKRERWQRIALAAAKQSGRTRIPEIGAALTFPEVVSAAAAMDRGLLFFENAGAVALPVPGGGDATAATAAVIVGPEGGFSSEEASRALNAGLAICSLGPRILRTETAAIVALALVQACFGDLVGTRSA
ncbi:MAG: 16S rRNA (uracil(1498)-N(3))-methyltransferase [Myxococcales bacterium]|jgi:16S rRNA (uracil1498-N3)-methyltransferase|nr:16S rRNA (uracil(1498)-N(3))-methyltransferase [Myxococcales bacterium]